MHNPITSSRIVPETGPDEAPSRTPCDPGSGGGPAPAELDALALGDEEQVVAQGVHVLVVDADDAEPAVAVGPHGRCYVAYHPGLRAQAPRVRQLQASLRQVEVDAPTLVGRYLEVAGEVAGRDHAVLEVLREGPLVGPDAGEVVRVVYTARPPARGAAAVGHAAL